MMRILAVVAFMVFAADPHVADAAGAAIHSEPAADDNLRLYAFVDVPAVTFVLDDGPPLHITGMSIAFTRLEPGPHQATVTLPDGSHASLAFTLSADALIESKGHRWWCLMAGRRADTLTVIQPTTAQCKKVADAGPD